MPTMQILSAILLISFVSTAHAASFNSWNEACLAADSVVQEGDLIFIDRPYYLFRRVAEATNTWTSHVGIVFKDEHGKWLVSESRLPVSSSRPLCDYLRDSSKFRFEVRRLNKGLSQTELTTMKQTSESLMGRLYHLGFDFDSDRLFCSKFVYLVFKKIGIEVGELKSFGELLEEDAENPSVGFWRFWFFGSIPKENRTITPASQLLDTKFTTVLESF